jgi:hypothetical protein
MNTKLIAAVLIAASTAIAAPAFARGGSGGGSAGSAGSAGGGTGPAGPVGYDWGATAQGQRVQQAWAERQGADRNANTAYGGGDSTGSQSGAPSPVGEGH